MKKIFVISFAMAMSLMARGEGFIASVYNQGKLQGEFALQQKPVLAFSDDKKDIVVSVGGNQEISFTALGTSVTFREDGTTAIDAVSTGSKVPMFCINEGSVAVSGLTPGETVSVYSVNGQMISTARADASGSVSANVDKGIFIMKAGKVSFKFYNK